MDSESYWPHMNVGLGIGAAGDGRGQVGARTGALLVGVTGWAIIEGG